MTAAANLRVGWQLLPTCGLGGSDGCRTRVGWAAAAAHVRLGGGNDGCRLYLGVCGDADRCPYADDAP